MSFGVNQTTSFIEKKTKTSLIWTSLLNEIFISFFGLMPFILRKDLFATTFQISLFTMLKPAVAFFSFYWSSRLIRSKSSLRNNLIIAGVLARLPFLFIMFFDSIWYLIFASATYMLFSRAAVPAWMEILKLNLPKYNRERFFSLGSVLAYSEGVAIAIFIGTSLDNYQNAWKFFFFFSSILGLIGVFIQSKTPIYAENIPSRKNPIKFSDLVKPWKIGFELMKKRPDFLKFQIGTLSCGFAIMLAMPALTIFYADNLSLLHSDITIARYVFMGLGFVFLSPVWAKALNQIDINKLLGFVCIGFALFPLIMMFALISKSWIYVAFLSYGITQAGSSLIWNLSGPTFAKDEDSSIYTGINVLMVGLRGLVAPLLGGLLCEIFGIYFVFVLSILISLIGSYLMLSKKEFSLKSSV